MPHATAIAMDPSRIETLSPPWQHLIGLGTVDSTQAEAARRLERGESMRGVALMAREQTAGRGRMTRGWVSAEGGVYVTVGLPWSGPLSPDLLGWIPLAGALSAAEAIRARFGIEALIKWPNDVLVGDAKLAGLLGDLAEDDKGPLPLLGMGLNWSNPLPEALEDGRREATSLARLSPGGLALDPREWVGDWLERLGRWLVAWGESPEWALGGLRRTAEANLWRRGETVCVEATEDGVIHGRLLGLGRGASLRVEPAGSTTREFHCGRLREPASAPEAETSTHGPQPVRGDTAKG